MADVVPTATYDAPEAMLAATVAEFPEERDPALQDAPWIPGSPRAALSDSEWAASGPPLLLRYTLLFLLGGGAFAVVSYLIGSWIYGWELHLADPSVPHPTFLTLAGRIPVDHGLTFFPWLVSTTLLAILIGYLFDRQHRLVLRLEMLAVTDGLTLIYNHRYFIRALHQEIARMGRRRDGFSLLLVDLDDFKRYNDTHGHLAGDDVLRLAAHTIRSAVRETDVVARYGGEEFVVLALGTDPRGALVLAEKIRIAFAGLLPVTASIGVATFAQDGESVDQLIQAADAAMYRAKQGGKDRACSPEAGAMGPNELETRG